VAPGGSVRLESAALILVLCLFSRVAFPTRRNRGQRGGGEGNEGKSGERGSRIVIIVGEDHVATVKVRIKGTEFPAIWVVIRATSAAPI